MFKKIVVAIDGSEISKRAFDRAIDLAHQNGAELHGVYVIESGIVSPAPVDTTWELVYARFEKEGHIVMDELTGAAQAKGVKFEVHLEAGHAGDTIIEVAGKIGADLIILGSLGKSKLDRLLLGSVSSYVVNYSKTNTMIVRT
jgi:nucleotide-binding universal stress UspA family protein